MDDALKKFIETHKEAFSDSLPENHEARFLQKLAAARNRAGQKPAGVSLRKMRRIGYTGVAASLILITGLSLFLMKRTAPLTLADPCSGNDSACYLSRMSTLADQIYTGAQTLPQREREAIETALEQVLNAPDGLSAALPEELNPRQCEEILKDYYSSLYFALCEIASADPSFIK